MLIRRSGRSGRDQRGDTIVEVMVVLAVLGLAIGIAYATANRSLLNARQAQENSQATAAAQTQVERIISIGCTSGNPECDITNSNNPGYGLLHPPGGGVFCLTPNSDPEKPALIKASSDAACGQQTALPGSSVQITCLNGCAAPRVFEVKVAWDDILGQGTDTVTQDYTLPDTTTPPPSTPPPSSPPPPSTPPPSSPPPALPFTLSAANKQCHGVGLFGAGDASADLVVTGPAGDAVTISSTVNYYILGFLFDTETTSYNVTLDANGTATQHVDTGSGYWSINWTATATDASGNSATVSPC